MAGKVVQFSRAHRAAESDRETCARWEAKAGEWASAEILPADGDAAFVSVQHRSDTFHIVQNARGQWEATFATANPAVDVAPPCGASLGTFGSLADALEAIWPTRGPGGEGAA